MIFSSAKSAESGRPFWLFVPPLWRDSWAAPRSGAALSLTRYKRRPSAGVVDSQSAEDEEIGGSRRFDAAKRVKGRRPHVNDISRRIRISNVCDGTLAADR
jgi:hypothetical protein